MVKAYELKAKIIEVGTMCGQNPMNFIITMVWCDDLITCASAEGHVIPTGVSGCTLHVTSPLSAGCAPFLSAGKNM